MSYGTMRCLGATSFLLVAVDGDPRATPTLHRTPSAPHTHVQACGDGRGGVRQAMHGTDMHLSCHVKRA
jgi:hypothetical protein